MKIRFRSIRNRIDSHRIELSRIDLQPKIERDSKCYRISSEWFEMARIRSNWIPLRNFRQGEVSNRFYRSICFEFKIRNIMITLSFFRIINLIVNINLMRACTREYESMWLIRCLHVHNLNSCSRFDVQGLVFKARLWY